MGHDHAVSHSWITSADHRTGPSPPDVPNLIAERGRLDAADAPRGGGGSLSLRVRVRHSDFSGCDTRDHGIVTLVDRAGAGRDSLVLTVCHSKTPYVEGGPHHTRVFTLVGQRR